MPWQSSELCALDTLQYLLIQSIKKVWKILFSRGEKTLNPAQFATCPPSVFRHSRQANSALSGPKFWAGRPKFCTGPIICTSSKFCLVLDLLTGYRVGLKVSSSDTPKIPSIIMSSTHWILSVTTNKMSCNVKLRKLHISNHVSPPRPEYLAGSNLKD